MNKSTFCAVPWNEVYITSNGTYGMCCLENQNSNQSRVSIVQDLSSHWNSEYMKKARLALLGGDRIKPCEVCWKDEDAGKISGRMRRNQTYYGRAEPELDEIKQITQPNGSIEPRIRGLFFSVGNLCQLRCIDCAPSYSRSILKDYAKLGWSENTKSRRFILEQDLINDEKMHSETLWQRIEEIAPSVDWIRVQGGEPSISKPLLNFLQKYAEQGHAQSTTIMLATNAVNIKQDFIDALKPFRQVKFEISVDGVGDLDEYLRFPTNWNKKEAILDKLIDNFPESIIHSTMYSLNIGGLYDLIKWAETKPVLHSIQCLTYPDELSVHHLPDTYKSYIIDQLQEYLPVDQFEMSDHYDPVSYRNNCVKAVIGRLKEDRNPVQWQKAKDTIHAYDTIRDKPLGSIIPSLKYHL